ncbi:MAG: PAS domain S-box protein [Candidatus Methanoperedens sp.]|uniref:PAS domain-containing hybrid sensor histidine kinase/response regulator n=1 Tax=Candidatus Methanoperedens sp. BLZ2 TaxID=2035255 RepID=UPI001596406A|nr:PAS domain S-box protein [Candidatus Methanoperedens sp. BLZ2]MBZ0173727.1 PAS domain S-box protein [Candidatus Methanoperedens nitroreducens]MCX9079043.1 PAS domain S-box protein [Candidatus Methanoperedens sp.]
MKLEESKIQRTEGLKNTDLYKYLAAISIPAFIVLLAILTPFDNRVLSEPLWLLPILNTVFIFVIYLSVAYICAKSYLASGSPSIFLLGCGMLAFGSASLLGGWLIAAPGGINVNVTLVNVGALFGSIFHLTGAMLTLMRINAKPDLKRRKRNLTLAYPGILISIILLTIVSFQGITPPFFLQGTGPTPLRQVVLGTAAMLFAISAFLFMRLYFRLKEIYLYWYFLALMLVSINLFAALFVHTVGSLFSWAVRLPLYFGGIYFLNAIFIARRTALNRGTSIEEAVANFFREPDENFRVLIETANDAIVSFDNEGRVLLWNSAAEKIFSYNRSEAVGSIFSDLIIPDSYADILKKEMKTLTVTGKSTQIRKTIEMEAKRKDGKVFPVEFSISARKTSNGWIYTGIIRDITRRKRAEEALHKAHNELELRVQERTAELKKANKALLESEASYRELTESIDDLFYAMDGDLRYTYWNKASEALIGILAKDAIGKSLYKLFPEVKGTKVEQTYIEALKTQQPQRIETEYQIGDKKLIFEINVYPSKDGLSVITKDITERKMFETQLLRAQRMESIGILAGGIAHNLNNMLTPIMLSLQMLKQKFKDEQSHKLLTILENNSQRSADLIKQVLSFSGGVEGERAPLEAKHLITEIEKVANETFPRNIEIRTDIPENLLTISGDVTQLHQVIMNLCVNARDAMPDGGILNISAENFFIDESYTRMHIEAKIGSYVIIAVSDTGIGIPHEILDRIFEPFFTTREFGKGTGLGLSTSLAIVKSHGGFINVYSEVGKGTKFSIYLPAIKTRTEIQNAQEQKLELLFGHGELVLIAEDEDSVRDVTVSTLEKNGYIALAAKDGADAVVLYAQNKDKVKVVLMDMMMPIMDGQASIRAIRKINYEVKIIAVSGLTEKDRLKNVADYTNSFLPKPYTAEILLKTIHEVLSAK